MRFFTGFVLILTLLLPQFMQAQCEVRILNEPAWCCAYPLQAGPVSGTPPFTYQWSTGNVGPYSDTACTGTTYYVTMTDSAGCTAVDSVYVPLDTGNVYFSAANAPCSTCTGSIIMNRTITSCGAYSIATDPPVPIGPKYYPNTYVVTYTDVCGCKVVDTVIVGVDTALGIPDKFEGSTFRQMGNTVLFDQPVKEVRIYDLQGRLVRSVAWVRYLELEGLVPGVYLLERMDKNGGLISNQIIATGVR